jgi:raffinose synthase
VYLVMLPLLEGQFWAALQGSDRDELQVCVESGNKAVRMDQCAHATYLHLGKDGFWSRTGSAAAW